MRELCEYIPTLSNSSAYEYVNEDACTSTSDSGDGNSEHAQTILNYFHQLYMECKGTDVDIYYCDEWVAKVHRIIIASFCRTIAPVIEGKGVTKFDIPSSLGVNVDDLREIINFLYTGRIVIRRKDILEALEELGCTHILPLLQDVWTHGSPVTVVEDNYHALYLMNRLKGFWKKKKYIDCCLKLERGVEVECHRWVMAVFSSLVINALQNMERSAIIHLEIPGITTVKSVSQLMDFIYSSKLPLSNADYSQLKDTAVIFGVDKLVTKLRGTFPPDDETLDEYYGPSFYDESTTMSHTEDEDCAASVEITLTSENEYASIYNQYVEGPMLAVCSDGVDPADEFIIKKPKVDRYKCPTCDYKSSTRTSIWKHIRSVHTKESPYVCSVCNAAFKVQSNLARHRRTHSQIKPYKCKSCGIAYADKKNVEPHIFRAHLNKAPFKCPHKCKGARFYREDSWRKHCRRFHPDAAEIAFELQDIEYTM